MPKNASKCLKIKQNRIFKSIFQGDFEAFLAVLDKSRFIRTKNFFRQDDPLKDEVSLLGQKNFEFASL